RNRRRRSSERPSLTGSRWRPLTRLTLSNCRTPLPKVPIPNQASRRPSSRWQRKRLFVRSEVTAGAGGWSWRLEVAADGGDGRRGADAGRPVAGHLADRRGDEVRCAVGTLSDRARRVVQRRRDLGPGLAMQYLRVVNDRDHVLVAEVHERVTGVVRLVSLPDCLLLWCCGLQRRFADRLILNGRECEVGALITRLWGIQLTGLTWGHERAPAPGGPALTGKHSLSLARGSGPWPVMPVRAGLVRQGSGCLGECDGVAECFELADVAAGLALLVGAAGVVGAAEVAGGGGGVG